MNELGKLLTELRGEKSLRDIATRAGISHSYLSNLEKGIDPRSRKTLYPSPETLRQLAQAYDYPYEKLLVAAGYIKEKPLDLALLLKEPVITYEGRPLDARERVKIKLALDKLTSDHSGRNPAPEEVDSELIDIICEVIERKNKKGYPKE